MNSNRSTFPQIYRVPVSLSILHTSPVSLHKVPNNALVVFYIQAKGHANIFSEISHKS